MKWHGTDIRLSASDLMRFMSCAHASFLDLERMHGRGPEPAEDSEDAALLQSQGDAHEAAHLAGLHARGDVVEIDSDQPFDDAVTATTAALQEGPATIFQGTLEDADLNFAVEDVSIARKGSRGEAPMAPPYDQIHAANNNNDPALTDADVVGGTAWLFSRPELADTFDYLFVDEAGQVSLANLIAMTNAARNIVLVGDPNQLPQVIQGAHPPPADQSCLDWMLGDATTVSGDRGRFLPVTRRMHPDLCAYISGQFYEGRLTAHDSTAKQAIEAGGLPRAGAFLVPVDHEGRAQECPEEIDAIRRTVDTLTSGAWTNRDGITRPLEASDIIVVAPYNVQINALSDALPGIRVGTVDKLQGQEAPVALISMTASTAEETSRGLNFLLSRLRLNVAISRGKALSLVFASPRLCETPCATVEQMRLVNALCALPEWTMEEGR